MMESTLKEQLLDILEHPWHASNKGGFNVEIDYGIGKPPTLKTHDNISMDAGQIKDFALFLLGTLVWAEKVDK